MDAVKRGILGFRYTGFDYMDAVKKAEPKPRRCSLTTEYKPTANVSSLEQQGQRG
jgi:hypothetical protein